jgi:hypothetical protein
MPTSTSRFRGSSISRKNGNRTRKSRVSPSTLLRLLISSINWKYKLSSIS